MSLQRQITRIIGPEIAGLPFRSARLYCHRLYKSSRFTDEVREYLCERRALWLMDRIFALQEPLRTCAAGRIQLWTLKNLPDGSVLLSCADKKTGQVLYYDHAYPERRLTEDLELILHRNILRVSRS